MGRATKWFRNLLGLKKPDPNPHPSSPTSRAASTRDKRRWSFVKSLREKHEFAAPQSNPNFSPYSGREEDVHQREPIEVSDAVADPGKHAIAVAAATAAVAEAAVAAAQAAAAAAVKLTSSGRCPREPAANFGTREQWAAVKIQSTFRGYLARRALRALRGLVRLQALVRGHIERKRTAQWMRSMQALYRAQVRARIGRSQVSESSQSSSKSTHFHHPGPQTPEKLEHRSRSAKFEQPSNLKRNGSKSNRRLLADHDPLCSGWNWSERVPSTRTNIIEHDDKIVEVDTAKPFTARRRNLFYSTHLTLTPEQFISSFTNSKESHQTGSSPSSPEVQSLGPSTVFVHEIEEPMYTAVNSPQFCSVSSFKGGASRRSSFVPTRSDCSRSYLSGYSEDFPSYMSYTESSKAKIRSVSAPKQRTQYERSSSAKRSVNRSSLYTSFASKAYPGSGRLDSFGMPIGQGY